MTTVNSEKFSNECRSHPNFQLIVDRINQSPSLVDAINQFEGSINLGAGDATSFNSINNQIEITEDAFRYASTPNKLDNSIFDIAHEIGHAVIPNGSIDTTEPLKNPEEAIRATLNAEGVAVTMEYRVARELGIPMDRGVDRDGSLKQAFDQLASEHGIDSEQFATEAMRLGGEAYQLENPSGLPNLTYSESPIYQWMLTAASDEIQREIPRETLELGFNHRAVTRNHFDYETNPQGETVFAMTLPFGAGNNAQNINYVGKTDALGQIMDLQQVPDSLQFNPTQAIESYQNQTHSLSPDSKETLSPEIEALHDKLGEALHPRLAALNVNKDHADAMVSTHTLDCVKAGICAEDIKATGVEPKSNLISTFHNKSEWIGVYTDAVAASRNNPEQTLQLAQQQLEQQPAQEQQRQQQLEQQTKERSGQSMGM